MDCKIKNEKIFFAINIIIPLFVGLVLYYVSSPDVIFVKRIDDFFYEGNHLLHIGLESEVFTFFRNYFLDMLWGYALVFSLHFINGNNAAELNKVFAIAFAFSAVLEILQLISSRGTFDVFDIVAEFFAESTAVFIIKTYTKEHLMKNRFKVLAILLCLVAFAAMALGSGSTESSKKDIVATEENSSSTEVDAIEEQADSEEASVGTNVTIDEQVVVDQDGIKITAIEYATDSIWGDGIKLLVENNSDQDYTVGCDALIVNDYMITDLFVSEIAAGKKANENMYLSSSELKAAGIDNVGKIEMYFHAYDSNYDYIFQNLYSEIQTSAYADMDTTPNDAGMELYNENGIRIVGKTVDENSFWGTAILLYCENTSGKNVGISVDDMSINGFMMSPFFSTTVYDGKKSIDEITIFSSDLEENGIEKIEDVELKFHIYDVDSFSPIADSEPITFSAQ